MIGSSGERQEGDGGEQAPVRRRRWLLGGGHWAQLRVPSSLPPLDELVRALQDELDSDAGERATGRPAPVSV